MKRFVILVCVIAVNIQALEVELISKVMDLPMNELAECMQKNGLSAEDIEDLENMFDEENSYIKEYSPNVGCFVACVFEKSNIMQDNEIRLNALIDLAKRNKFPISRTIREILNECIYEAELQDDRCKIGLVFSSCVIRKLRR